MKRSDAIKRYGKRMFSKMQKYLGGITVSIKDGQEDIPESDLECAYKQAKGKRVSWFEWD